MHKWTVLAVLLVAAVTVSNAQRRNSRLFRMNRPMSSPFRIQPTRQIMSYGGGYGTPYNMRPIYNVPMMPMMPGMGGRPRLPDGDYYGPHGTTSVDGSDISFDHHTDNFMIAPQMMG